MINKLTNKHYTPLALSDTQIVLQKDREKWELNPLLLPSMTFCISRKLYKYANILFFIFNEWKRREKKKHESCRICPTTWTGLPRLSNFSASSCLRLEKEFNPSVSFPNFLNYETWSNFVFKISITWYLFLY